MRRRVVGLDAVLVDDRRRPGRGVQSVGSGGAGTGKQAEAAEAERQAAGARNFLVVLKPFFVVSGA